VEFRAASESDLAGEYAVFAAVQEELHTRRGAACLAPPFDSSGMWAQALRAELDRSAGMDIRVDIPGSATALVEVALEGGLRLTDAGLLLLSSGQPLRAALAQGHAVSVALQHLQRRAGPPASLGLASQGSAGARPGKIPPTCAPSGDAHGNPGLVPSW
jgi:hypothetical protein